MSQTYRGRIAASIENDSLRVTVLREGGHIAEIFDKASGVNPLWTPPWPSIEPSAYSASAHPEYGEGGEAPLLAGIMGHNLCLDLFGPPSDAEAAAGIPAHGEISLARCDLSIRNGTLVTKANLPGAQLAFERQIELHGRSVRIIELVENIGVTDRPIAWTQHVTVGPPFLEPGSTEFRVSATRAQVFPESLGENDYLAPGAEFTWPFAPARSGNGSHDLHSYDFQKMPRAEKSGAFTTQLMNPGMDNSFFVAFSPQYSLAFGYVWKRQDFPWLGIWEENHSRAAAPWNSRTLTRGMEFGVSPFPETRRAMITRGSLFGVPGYRWLPAKTRLTSEYWAVVQTAQSVPESLEWPRSAS